MPEPTPAETLKRLHALRSEYTRRASRLLADGDLTAFSAYMRAIPRIRDAAERTFRRLESDHLAERFALRHTHPRRSA